MKRDLSGLTDEQITQVDGLIASFKPKPRKHSVGSLIVDSETGTGSILIDAEAGGWGDY